MMKHLACLIPLLLIFMSTPAQTPSHLKTRWTDHVSKTQPHPEYPRPQLVRKAWVNLNGLWDFALSKQADHASVPFDRKILVPFPVESTLSGVGLHVSEDDHLWYRRSFTKPAGDRILLHFGASDFATTVWINGKEVGKHKGGYDPFTFDITDVLDSKPQQEIIVHVTNPIDAGTQPRGKQVRKPGGIFYTSNSGIWQTVWLEPVGKASIEKVDLYGDPNTDELHVGFKVRGPANDIHYGIQVLDGNAIVAEQPLSANPQFTVKVPNVHRWSPEDPFLYDVRLTLTTRTGSVIDSVESYTAFRNVAVHGDADGVTRIFLNDKRCFMVGPLDQGFWPDGIYTAPTDDALKYDIEVTKQLGFNMIRKHVKVEPDRWYYWCDKLGILVWQDMPSGDGFITPSEPDIHRTPESAAQYELELKAMIDALRNHPSIVTWIPFNEGWGQFDTSRITDLIRAYDPTRIIDSTTGWSDRGVGDMIDWHIYPGPGSPKPEPRRAAVLGEFGGLGLPTPGHMWQNENWGYQSFKTPHELTDATVSLFERLRYLITDPGLSAAVYTQTTDVETEANGLMTYDRAVFKMDEGRLRKAIHDLFLPPIVLEEVIPTSEKEPQTWTYTTVDPGGKWTEAKFDDSGWQVGKGGFGSHGTPSAVIGTEWRSDDIWLRNLVTIPDLEPGTKLYFRLHHDDDAEVYIDGKLALKASGALSSYVYFPVPKDLNAKLHSGKHLIAVHCHQIRGDQYIDLGIYREH